LRDGGLISLLMKPFVSHQRAIKRCQRYIISMIDIAYNLCRPVQQQCVHGSPFIANRPHENIIAWKRRMILLHTIPIIIPPSKTPTTNNVICYKTPRRGLLQYNGICGENAVIDWWFNFH